MRRGGVAGVGSAPCDGFASAAGGLGAGAASLLCIVEAATATCTAGAAVAGDFATISVASCACWAGSEALFGSGARVCVLRRTGRAVGVASVLGGNIGSGCATTCGWVAIVRVLKGRSGAAGGAVAKPGNKGAPCKTAPWTRTTATLNSARARRRRVSNAVQKPGAGVIVTKQFNSERQFRHETCNLP